MIAATLRRFGLVTTTEHNDDAVSDYVKTRLWLARQIALARFQKLYG